MSIGGDVQPKADSETMVGRRWGEGPDTFVLLHGLGIASRMVAPLATRLARHGTVLAPDLPGFGARSDEEPLSLPDQARVLADRFGDQRVTLVGCSLGAQLAIRVAASVGRSLRALVLASPTVDRHRRSWWSQLSRWPLEAAVQPPLLRRIQFEDHRAAGYRRLLRTFGAALADRPEDLLDRIEVPTLVLRGTRDPLVGDRWAGEVAAGIPKGHLVVLEARHPMTFTEPGLCASALLAFLDRVGPG